MLSSQKQSKPSMMDRLLTELIPSHILQSKYAFQAKVLVVYSGTIGTLFLLVITGLVFAEGDISLRRWITALLASLLVLVIYGIRRATRIHGLCWYAIAVSIALVFHIEFNNQSIDGPFSILWFIPTALSSLFFPRRILFILNTFIILLFLSNAYLLSLGLLPAPILQPESWLAMKIIAFILTGIIMILIIHGNALLGKQHIDKLHLELKDREARHQEINDLKMKAEASNHSKSLFLSTMSHELRTPLNSVIGNAQLLSCEDFPKKHQQKINDIADAGNLLLNLINDILDFSKLQENKLELIEAPFNLTKKIESTVRLIKPKLHSGVVLKTILPEKDIFIQADHNRISQVLINLLSNAAKFTQKGQITLTLEIESTDDKEGLIDLSIKDSGIGIDKNDMSKLFKRFSQVSHDTNMNMEGSGLGLAISKGIIKQMQGDIKVQSELGEGSCFTVILPKTYLTDSIAEPSHPPPQPQPVSEKLNILIADDIAMNRLVLTDMLLTLGIENTALAEDGQKAIDHIKEHPDVQIIFMDMRMPKIDGLEATRAIREMEFKGFIIAVTANASAEDQAACLASGMDYFIPKPIVLRELSQSLQEFSNQASNPLG